MRKTLHRTENNNLLLQPPVFQPGLQGADSGTPTSVEAGAGITSTATSCRRAGLLLIRPGRKADGRHPAVKESKLRASRLSGKKSLIRRADIELMMKTKPYERIMPKDDFDITEYYTAEEIAQKYKVNTKWVWTYTRQHKVPKVRIRQFNYYSKKHIDAAFAKYEVDSDLTEWYTPEEIQGKYGMTRIAIRSHVYRNNIPSKKEHGQIYYSKLHFDLSKSSAEESKAEYYTVKEAMERMQNDLPLTLVCMFSFPTFAVKSVLTIKFSCYARM